MSGTNHSSVTGMVGGVSYRNVLKLHFNADGFFLDVMPLFRVGHPCLFVPWSEISARTSRQVFWWKAETLSIGHPACATLTLPADLLAQHAAG